MEKLNCPFIVLTCQTVELSLYCAHLSNSFPINYFLYAGLSVISHEDFTLDTFINFPIFYWFSHLCIRFLRLKITVIWFKGQCALPFLWFQFTWTRYSFAEAFWQRFPLRGDIRIIAYDISLALSLTPMSQTFKGIVGPKKYMGEHCNTLQLQK